MSTEHDSTPFMPLEPFLDFTKRQKLPPPRLSLSSIWSPSATSNSDMASSIWSISSTSEGEEDADWDPFHQPDDPLRAIWSKSRRSSLSSHATWPMYASPERRHSVAGPLMTTSEDDAQFSRHQQHILNKGVRDHIDEYFGGPHGPQAHVASPGRASFSLYSPPAPGRTMTASGDAAAFGCTTVLMGKGIPLHHFLDSNTLLYTVEFKSNRRDICYIMQDDTLAPQLHDLVLVEADRGRDLGKVVRISTANEIMDTQTPTNAATTPTSGNANGSDPESLAKCHVKRLFRLAEQDEIQSMETKQKEEEMALAFCRSKIIQKDLPMQVVNAEFQWDRRKLTFYFKADQRIDFRELVRDLFKTYKTRIWMCALNGANDD